MDKELEVKSGCESAILKTGTENGTRRPAAEGDKPDSGSERYGRNGMDGYEHGSARK